MSTLKGKVAIVTGGSRGIGRAIVTRLAQEQCAIAFNYYQACDEAALQLEDEIKAKGVGCQSQCVDVRNFDNVKGWIAQVKENFGRIDILINNAGIIIDRPLMMMSPEDWAQVIHTNLDGMFNTARSCIVTFLKQRKGDIINISSVSGIFGLAGQTNYSASKGGVNAFTKALAKEVAPWGVRVNAVAPGFIDTAILSQLTEEHKKEIVSRIPLQRLGQPQEVAHCVAFLLSDGAQYITGQIIQIDGGLAIR